ncbi:MAG TPA: hypothetical protein VLC91_07930 [Spongiibacteraceae bacterium]|nr:hypothetical protein [Spongiibacteraceae bacterium]
MQWFLSALLLVLFSAAPSTQLYADDSANTSSNTGGTAFGNAYTLDGAQLLYTETHHWQGPTHTVEYFRPNGDLIAVNRLDSSLSFVSPTYTQLYPSANFSEGARWHNADLVLFFAAKEQVVSFQKPLVLSSGFYHFVLEHWRDLHAGQAQLFDFAVPSRWMTVRLRMHALDSNAGTTVIRGGDPSWFYVRVEAANPLLRWLVHPLTVALDDRQRLMVYRGVSSVRDERGETPQVLIHYRYPDPVVSSVAP